MNASVLTVIATAIVAYGVVSIRAQESLISPAMAFAVLGYGLGAAGLGWIDGDPENSVFYTLAELTLVVVLYTDASRINGRRLWKEHNLPVRLLLIALPLTIAAGTVAATVCFPEFSVWHAALLATIVAPTDASLAHPVVANQTIPPRVRQTISVESGLNDGLCVPLVLLLLCGARSIGHDADAAYWAWFAVMQITLGPLVGIAVGYLGGRILKTAVARKWAESAFVDLAALALAAVAFGAAELAGGNGFIAAFCAGLTMGHFAPSLCRRLHEFGEAEGQLLTLMVFLFVGAAMTPQITQAVTWPSLLFALLSLTVLRIVPVTVSLLGTGLRVSTLAFIGWFGPRGAASVIFALLAIQDSRVPLRHEIFIVVMTTVLMSVFAHGLTAVPFSRWYGRGLSPTDSTLSEHQPIEQLPFCCRMSAASTEIEKVSAR